MMPLPIDAIISTCHMLQAALYQSCLFGLQAEVERTDVSEPIVETLTASDWVPKLRPDFKVRET